ncbi:MAG: holin family protein [Bdellovibrionales bacterium]
MWEALVSPVCKLIDKIIPDPAAREEAKLKLLQAEGQQTLQEMQAQLSPILAEAQSTDPWTSRARPSFMYVIYVLLLASIPMGALFAFDAELAQKVTQGFKSWLAAIPDPIIQLFGMGYLGYTGARSFEKWKGGNPKK